MSLATAHGWVPATARAQLLRGQRSRKAAAQLAELADRVADAAVHGGGHLHHRSVRLERHAVAQPGRQRRLHRVGAERQRPVDRVEEHELILDPDRQLAAGRARPPHRPRREIRDHRGSPRERAQSSPLPEALASETSAETEAVRAIRRRDMGFLLGLARAAPRPRPAPGRRPRGLSRGLDGACLYARPPGPDQPAGEEEGRIHLSVDTG